MTTFSQLGVHYWIYTYSLLWNELQRMSWVVVLCSWLSWCGISFTYFNNWAAIFRLEKRLLLVCQSIYCISKFLKELTTNNILKTNSVLSDDEDDDASGDDDDGDDDGWWC